MDEYCNLPRDHPQVANRPPSRSKMAGAATNSICMRILRNSAPSASPPLSPRFLTHALELPYIYVGELLQACRRAARKCVCVESSGNVLIVTHAQVHILDGNAGGGESSALHAECRRYRALRARCARWLTVLKVRTVHLSARRHRAVSRWYRPRRPHCLQ
jgi:hypothetical protein